MVCVTGSWADLDNVIIAINLQARTNLFIRSESHKSGTPGVGRLGTSNQVTILYKIARHY
jgi:hypothetical protein